MNPVFAAAACFSERISVNSVTHTTWGGRAVFVKRRRLFASPILAGANLFFRLARNPIRALAALPEWQRWEVECFRLLHGPEYFVDALDSRTIAAEAFSGMSLSRALETKSLTPAMVAAAGRELRRCHETSCAIFPDHWTHGDPHAGNFLYDAASDRARLIDFEVMHHPSLCAAERRTDDLLVFLQDVVGRVSRPEWLPLATAFLNAYDHPETTDRLRTRLILPRGIPRLWWAIRTTYLPGPELAHRLELMREALGEAALKV